LFDDLIPDKREPDTIPITKDSLIEAMKDNIKLKEAHIRHLLTEIVSRGVTIDGLRKELDYLKKL